MILSFHTRIKIYKQNDEYYKQIPKQKFWGPKKRDFYFPNKLQEKFNGMFRGVIDDQ